MSVQSETRPGPEPVDGSAGRTREGQGGPPPGILAVVFTALFVAGLVLGTLLAGGDTFPSPFGDAEGTVAYFREHGRAVQVMGALQVAAAVPLAVYAATVSARLHRLGVRAPGATIALAGGVLASAFLTLSGLTLWVLSRPELGEAPALIRALHQAAFAAGGPAHVAPLGLLVAGLAVPGLLAGLLPRWLAMAGLAIAGLAELSVLVLLADGLAPVLPLARFTALAWLVAAGFLLPSRRIRSGGAR
ncbi:hypothetical protein [Kitasatospora sp. NPDC004289]